MFSFCIAQSSQVLAVSQTTGQAPIYMIDDPALGACARPFQLICCLQVAQVHPCMQAPKSPSAAALFAMPHAVPQANPRSCDGAPGETKSTVTPGTLPSFLHVACNLICDPRVQTLTCSLLVGRLCRPCIPYLNDITDTDHWNGMAACFRLQTC